MNEFKKSYLDKFDFSSIYFEITSQCNAKCSYCYNNSSCKGEHMPFANIIDVMEQAYGINPKTSFVFSGGEPLLHPNIINILKFAQGHESDITVITNASLIDKISINDTLQRCNIQVTIESLNQEEHDSIRGLCSFDNIKNLQKYIPNSLNKKRILRVNLMRNNIKYIEEFVKFAVTNQFNFLSFGFLVNQGRGKNNTEILDYEDDHDICVNVIRDIKKYSELYKKDLIIERKNCYPKVGCELTYTKNPSMAVRIDANGYVFPCLYFFDLNHSMGNVFNDSLRDILRSQRFLDLLNTLLHRETNIESCKHCVWEKQCRKGCPALAYSKYGSLKEKTSCVFLREIYEKAIKSQHLKLKGIKGEVSQNYD